ncbi:hypothetical protein G6F62_014363 [Rhizopus arrhizus]|nr:hypothetical protein G6F62_014363 [Rhizopus arrhizus]
MAGQRAVDDERIALRTALAHQPRGNAARAVAALLGVGTVGIPDPVRGHRTVRTRRFDGQDLITAHAGMAIRQARGQLGRGRRGAVTQVDPYEIIARAMHLAEAQGAGTGLTHSRRPPSSRARTPAGWSVRPGPRAWPEFRWPGSEIGSASWWGRV